MLVAGGDQLTIAPQGRLIVPLALSGQDRRLRHERGHILVQIESRASQGRAHRYAFAQPGHQRHDHRSRGRSRAEQRRGPRGRAGGDDSGPARPGGARGRRGSSPIGRSGRQPDALHRTGARHAGRGDRRAGLAPARYRDERTRSARDPWSGHPAPTLPERAPSPMRTRDRAERAARPSHRAGKGFGWLDELASSWGYLAIIGVTLLVLAIPGLAFLQNLRAQWRGQSQAEGRRRRELVRG